MQLSIFKAKCELGEEGGLNGKEVKIERQAGVRACGQRRVILHEVGRSPISFYGSLPTPPPLPPLPPPRVTIPFFESL